MQIKTQSIQNSCEKCLFEFISSSIAPEITQHLRLGANDLSMEMRALDCHDNMLINGWLHVSGKNGSCFDLLF